MVNNICHEHVILYHYKQFKKKKKKIEKKKLIMVKKISYTLNVNSLDTRGEIAEFAYRVDLDEVAHNDPPHLDIHRLPSSL